MKSDLMPDTKRLAHLVSDLKRIISTARHRAFSAVNAQMLKAHYEIGKRIVEEEQKGEKRAGYGKQLIDSISKELIKEFGRGFSSTALRNMRLFYLIYTDKIHQTLSDEFHKGKIRQSVTGELHQKWKTVSPKLAWSHYCELIKIDDKAKREYFEKYAINENLSVRDLKRQIHSLHYERLLMSKDKKTLVEYERKGNIPTRSEDLIKDPYILDFLSLEEKNIYTEKELESRILDNLQKFLLELGQGFSFVARQKRISIDNEHFYIDLLFYNIYLRCYVVIELKTTKFKHEDAGQMNFYLNYVKKEINTNEDNEPIGILLCTAKDN
ncbi:MAG: PDDEXK nuclease domain-containing protein, partial [Nanoarchaeota archaeon]